MSVGSETSRVRNTFRRVKCFSVVKFCSIPSRKGSVSANEGRKKEKLSRTEKQPTLSSRRAKPKSIIMEILNFDFATSAREEKPERLETRHYERIYCYLSLLKLYT